MGTRLFLQHAGSPFADSVVMHCPGGPGALRPRAHLFGMFGRRLPTSDINNGDLAERIRRSKPRELAFPLNDPTDAPFPVTTGCVTGRMRMGSAPKAVASRDAAM